MSATPQPARRRGRKPLSEDSAGTVIYCRFFTIDMDKARVFAQAEGVSLHKFIRLLFQRALADYEADQVAQTVVS